MHRTWSLCRNTLELTVESIPASLVTSAALFLGGGTPATEIVFASLQTHEGQLSVYTSPDFEREIATMSEVKIASHVSTDHMLRRMFPSDEMCKVGLFHAAVQPHVLDLAIAISLIRIRA
jgi:hypothetical protein